MRIMLVILSGLYLAGCSVTTIAPAEQVEQKIAESPKSKELGRTVVKKQLVVEYRCDKSKVVNVQSTLNNKKNSAITLTFNQSAYKLSPNVTGQGKKYSNIRWIWFVDNQGKGTLTDNRHNVLAQNCVKR